MATMTMTIFGPFLWFAGWEELVIINFFSFLRNVPRCKCYIASSKKNSYPLLLLFLWSRYVQQPYILFVNSTLPSSWKGRCDSWNTPARCQIADTKKIARVKKDKHTRPTVHVQCISLGQPDHLKTQLHWLWNPFSLPSDPQDALGHTRVSTGQPGESPLKKSGRQDQKNEVWNLKKLQIWLADGQKKCCCIAMLMYLFSRDEKMLMFWSTKSFACLPWTLRCCAYNDWTITSIV